LKKTDNTNAITSDGLPEKFGLPALHENPQEIRALFIQGIRARMPDVPGSVWERSVCGETNRDK
jgi:hypothetical protein